MTPADDALVLAVAETWDRQPWEPFSFKIGDRVRIRLSAECAVQFWGPRGVRGHPDGIDGAAGVVTKMGPSNLAPWSDTHPICVTFDEPRMVQIRDGGPPKMAEGNYFAAIELEKIEDSLSLQPSVADEEPGA